MDDCQWLGSAIAMGGVLAQPLMFLLVRFGMAMVIHLHIPIVVARIHIMTGFLRATVDKLSALIHGTFC